MTDLGSLNGMGSNSVASGVNNSGLIVGAEAGATFNSQGRAFSEIGGVVTDLGTLGGPFSAANAVNNSGMIIGVSAVSQYVDDAFSYYGGVMTDLGALPHVAGGTDANSVNDTGLIVGSGIPFLGHNTVAISDFEGVMTDLNSVTSSEGTDITTLFSASYVNDLGQIVGQAVTSRDVQVAFLLMPTSNAPIQTLSDTPIFVPDTSNSALLLMMGIFGIAVAAFSLSAGCRSREFANLPN